MANIIYTEEQKPNQIWLWIVILSLPALSVYAIYQQVVMGIPFGNHPAPNFVLYLMGVFSLLLIWFFLTFRLNLKISDEGVHYNFKPISTGEKTIKWEDVEKCYVRRYKPLREYGGWGWRYGCRSGRAYNISGNMGLQIETKDGRKILIGTQRPDELQNVIMKEFHNKEQS